MTAGVALDRISSPTLIAAVLAGACLGFLPHNFNPARLFMGDSGSMLIGLMLAGAVTSLTGQFNYATLPASTTLPGAAACCCCRSRCWPSRSSTCCSRSCAAPARAARRSRRTRRTCTTGCCEIGHSHRRAVLIMYFWTALLAFGAVAARCPAARCACCRPSARSPSLGIVVGLVPRLRRARA